MPMICSTCNFHTSDSSRRACPHCGNALQYTLLGPLGGDPVEPATPAEPELSSTSGDSAWSYGEVQSEWLKWFRWVVVPCAAVGLIVGLTVLGFQLRGLYWLHQSSNWPTTEGRVVDSHFVREIRGGGRRHRRRIEYRPSITYSYQTDGRTYTSDRVSFGGAFGSDSGYPKDYRWKYQKDKTVTVHYNPHDPGTAVLETTMFAGATTALTIGIVLSMVSLLMVLYPFVPAVREALNDLGAGVLRIGLVKNLLGAK